MSPRSRRRTGKPTARRASPRSDAKRRIPRQRTAPEAESAKEAEPFVSNDDALLVLHRAVEDPTFQRFLDELPLVDLIGQFLDWVRLCEESAEQGAEAEDPAELHLAERLGVELIGCTAVERWRSRVLSLACSRWGLVSATDDGLERGPDILGWDAVDPKERAWARALVVAAAIECTARYVSAQHVEGDQVRHAFATMLASSIEESPWPLGLMSALRPDDLLSEHVDRIVLEHVTELRTWGVLADGDHLEPVPGAEPLLRSLSINLRADPVPVPTS